MKKKIIILLISLFSLSTYAYADSEEDFVNFITENLKHIDFITENEKTVQEQVYEHIDSTQAIRPYIVHATIKNTCTVYRRIGKQAIGKLESGERVEIIQDRGYKWYQIKKDDLIGWISVSNLIIDEDLGVDYSVLTEKQIIDFMETKELKSDTKYLLLCDVNRQKLYVIMDNTLLKTINCSTGKNISPTIRGTYKITTKGNWFYANRFGMGAKHWTRFHGAYLIHSIPMNKNKEVLDSTLGQRLSSGCIRVSVEDAKWIQQCISYNTSINII